MKSREDRIENIRKAVKAAYADESLKDYYTIKSWRGKPLNRKRISFDVDFMMFRIENSRTEIQQLTYLRSNSLPSDFFNDPESTKTQEAQEQILIDMVRGKGKDLLEDLKLRKQEDPCIITYDGYIVNGNRRTAALKYLGERYVDCVVLPEDATPKDIYSLEQQLQISKDFRENYHWINELRNIRRGLEDTRYGFKEAELASNLRMDLNELRVKKRMIELVDSFLIWKNVPGQYDDPKLDDVEEIIRQLEKGIKKYKNDQIKLKSLQNAVFSLIEERPSQGRLYGYVSYLIKTFDQAYSKITAEQGSGAKTEAAVKPEPQLNLLYEVIDEHNLSVVFEDPTKAKEVSNGLVELIADVKAENQEKRDTEAVYEGVSIALRELQGLTLDNDTAKLDSVQNKLEQIIKASNRLLEDIKSIRK